MVRSAYLIDLDSEAKVVASFALTLAIYNWKQENILKSNEELSNCITSDAYCSAYSLHAVS
jgi:hypothetical protein